LAGAEEGGNDEELEWDIPFEDGVTILLDVEEFIRDRLDGCCAISLSDS
jgi:hypothetical protein